MRYIIQYIKVIIYDIFPLYGYFAPHDIIINDSDMIYNKGSGIKYGQYSLHFANNDEIRAYYYGEQPITIFKTQKQENLQHSEHQSIVVRPDFQAFQDCIEHLKASNNSSFWQQRYLSKRGLPPNKTIMEKEFLQELLRGGIQCQHLNSNTMEQFPDYSQNVSLNSCPVCDWEYVPDEINDDKWIFNIILKHSHHPNLVKDEKQIEMTNNKNLFALTCTPAFCMRERVLHKKCKVTFAIPFVMIKDSFNQSFENGIILIVLISLFFLLLIFVSTFTFYLLKRRNTKR